MDVSIITPMFHGNKYVNKLSIIISDIVKKSPQINIEWIIINDLPNSDISLPKIRKKNLNLKYIKNSTNLGIQKSRIKGIRNAAGKYILLLDQDDYIDKNILNICLSKIKNYDACIVNGYAETSLGMLQPLFKTNHQMEFVNNIKYYFYIGNLIASPGMVIIKREAISDKWLNCPLKINGADDWLLWVTMLAENKKFLTINKKMYIHRKDGKNTSDNNHQMLLSSLEAAKLFGMEFQSYSKLVKKYIDRLKMRNRYEEQGYSKLIEYIKHPDIAFYLYRLKK